MTSAYVIVGIRVGIRESASEQSQERTFLRFQTVLKVRRTMKPTQVYELA